MKSVVHFTEQFFYLSGTVNNGQSQKLEIQLFIRTNAFEAKAFMTNKVNLIISFYFWLFCHLLHFDNLKFMSRIKQDRLRAVTGIVVGP